MGRAFPFNGVKSVINSLFRNTQFINNMRGFRILLYYKQGIADVHASGTLGGGTESDVARQTFIIAVEGRADRSKAVPISSPLALNTGLPELPPVLSVSTMKHTGMRPSGKA